MNLYRLFSTLGKPIALTGLKDFHITSCEAIKSELSIDSARSSDAGINAACTLRIEVSRISCVKSVSLCANTIVHSFISFKIECLFNKLYESRTTELYAKLFCSQRHLRPHASANQLHLACNTKGRCYLLCVYRPSESEGFSVLVNALFKNRSIILLSTVGNHLALTMPTQYPHGCFEIKKESPVIDVLALRYRFTKRLQISELKLSPWEIRESVDLPADSTAVKLANQLNLRVSTIGIYLEHAKVKMKTEGRNLPAP